MSSSVDSAFQIDKKAIAQSFNQACQSYDQAARLQNEVGDILFEKLNYMNVNPNVIVDLGCGTGTWSQALKKKYKKSHVLSVDLAEDMLKVARQKKSWLSKQSFICADAESLPLADNSVDIVFANLCLQWLQDPKFCFQEIFRVLKQDGLFLFSSFGPDTLKELRDSWAKVDDAIHVNRFIDMHDLGDQMMHAGLKNPVMEMEMLSMPYASVKELMQELKAIGAHNLNQGRPSGLMGKNKIKKMYQAYEVFRQADGSLPASYEIIFGHGWVGKKTQAKAVGDIGIHTMG